MTTGARNNDYSSWEYRTKFEDYIHGYEHEHELIDRKETWLLTSQTILFAALGLTLQAKTPAVKLILVIAGVGLFLCVAITLGLVGNVSAKRCLYSDYKHFVNSTDSASTKIPKIPSSTKTPWGKREAGEVEFGVRTPLTVLGIITDFLIPLAFAGAWSYVLFYAAHIA